jgi:hypothetical protein
MCRLGSALTEDAKSRAERVRNRAVSEKSVTRQQAGTRQACKNELSGHRLRRGGPLW